MHFTYLKPFRFLYHCYGFFLFFIHLFLSYLSVHNICSQYVLFARPKHRKSVSVIKKTAAVKLLTRLSCITRNATEMKLTRVVPPHAIFGG